MKKMKRMLAAVLVLVMMILMASVQAEEYLYNYIKKEFQKNNGVFFLMQHGFQG